MSSPASRSPLRLALGWVGWWVVLAALWLYVARLMAGTAALGTACALAVR